MKPDLRLVSALSERERALLQCLQICKEYRATFADLHKTSTDRSERDRYASRAFAAAGIRREIRELLERG